MSKIDDLEALKGILRVAVRKVEDRYMEMYKDLPPLIAQKKAHKATKSLMTRVLNGTS